MQLKGFDMQASPQLELAVRHCAARAAQHVQAAQPRASHEWVSRLNESPSRVARAVQRARAIADAFAPQQGTGDGLSGKSQKRQWATGTLKAVPALQQPEEMFNSAMKALGKIQPRTDLQPGKARAANAVRCTRYSLVIYAMVNLPVLRKCRGCWDHKCTTPRYLACVQAARSLDAMLKAIATRLRSHCNAYPEFETLHPFEQSLLDLSVGRDNYWRIINNVDKLRKSINQVRSALIGCSPDCVQHSRCCPGKGNFCAGLHLLLQFNDNTCISGNTVYHWLPLHTHVRASMSIPAQSSLLTAADWQDLRHQSQQGNISGRCRGCTGSGHCGIEARAGQEWQELSSGSAAFVIKHAPCAIHRFADTNGALPYCIQCNIRH